MDAAMRKDGLERDADSAPHRLRASLGAILVAALVVLAGGCAGSPDEGQTTSEPAPAPASPSSAATVAVTKGGFARLSDRRLAYACHNLTPGSSGPTVVLVTGLDNDMRVWDRTITRLGATPVCTYDRANNGGSDVLPGPRPFADSVSELGEFLDSANVPGPYILVGHSFGGLLSMLYAAQRPEDVRALVLVDALLPFEDELDAMVNDAAELKKIRQEMNTNREGLAIYGHLPNSQELARSLPPVPTVYLFGAKQDLTEPGWPPGAYLARLNGFIRSLPEGSVIQVNAGHGIPVEDPDAIAAQIMATASRL